MHALVSPFIERFRDRPGNFEADRNPVSPHSMICLAGRLFASTLESPSISVRRAEPRSFDDEFPCGTSIWNSQMTSHPSQRKLFRREFLQQGMVASATMAGLASSRLAAATPPNLSQSPLVSAQDLPQEEAPMKIIDTHQHLWDLERFEIPWLKNNERLGKNFLIAEYMEATKSVPIERSIYMEVDVAIHQKVAEAEYLIELCQDDSNSTVAAVVSAHPLRAGYAEFVRRFSKEPCIKGIRSLLIGGSPQGECLQDEYVQGIQLLGELGLSFDICIRPGELPDAATLAERCPDTRFILDHCGNADPVAFADANHRSRQPQHDADDWRRAIDALGECENVVCKISGIVARVNPDKWSADDLSPIVHHCRDAFGEDRLMFASDWPVCTGGAPLAEWIAALKTIVADWPPTQQTKLFYDNAALFYALESIDG